MKKYYSIIFVAIILIGLLIFAYKDKSVKYEPSEAQKKVNLEIGEGAINIKDLKYDENKDVDFEKKKAEVNFDGKKVDYEIIDILQPFDLDEKDGDEYPFLLKATYNDGEKQSYLVIARKDEQENKFKSVDQIKVGNPDKVDEIHELDDHEVVIEAIVGKGDQETRAHLSYKLENDKIVPDPNNIDIDDYTPPTPTPTQTEEKNNNDNNQTNNNQNGGDLGKVALSFDDGPGTFTPNVLDALKSKGVVATFFMIGENTQKHPDFVKKVHDAGHEIGNHTWDHPDLTKLSSDSQKDEIQKTNDVINKLTGASPHWLRPPYGNFDDDTENVLSSLGMQKVLWNVDTRDWSGLSADDIYNRAVDGLKDGAIILMHDGVNNSSETAKAVPKIIDTIKNQGYEIVTISNL